MGIFREEQHHSSTLTDPTTACTRKQHHHARKLSIRLIYVFARQLWKTGSLQHFTMSHKLVSNLGVAGGLWSDPLSYILPYSDADYQQALQERSLDPDKYSSLNGLFASFG